jgi:peptidyl-prolyl cis-trans isomerase A (cyclophilin A)
VRIFAFLVIASSLVCAQTSTSSSKPTTSATHHTAAGAKPATPQQATPAANPVATIHTTAGDLTCELFPKQAPKTVANFVGLARGTKDWKDPATGKTKHDVPFYNGTSFHRVIPNFMIQGGDPLGNGQGGPGYSFDDELLPDLNFDVPGRIAMANSGPNTNGSQFFITEVPNPALNACFDEGGCDRPGRHVDKGAGYSIFGQCSPESVELVKQIARKATDPRDNHPYDPVKITTIDFTGLPKPVSAPAKKTPARKIGTASKTSPPKQPAPKQK